MLAERQAVALAGWNLVAPARSLQTAFIPETVLDETGAGKKQLLSRALFSLMISSKRILGSLLLLFSLGAHAQTDSAALQKISDDILLHGTCYDNLRTLCKTVGHRLSGSPQAEKAVLWGQQALQTAGADRVWLQPATVPKWIRGRESLKIDFGNGLQEVPVLSLGNSHGTDGKDLSGNIVMAGSVDSLKAMSPEAVKGKIVFLNYRFRQDFVNTFRGYGDAAPNRSRAANAAAALGAKAVIIRSVSTGLDDYPHTGMMRYTDSTKKIPAVAIGNQSADALEKAFISGKTPRALLRSECRMAGTAPSFNVIGEIKGSEKPDEIIVVSGHLDSWDVGEGAHDDGAGCVQAIETIRTLKALGLRPKRTIRAVLWMNEENGVRGGSAYADSAAAKGEKNIFAFESDGGGHSPRGLTFEFPEKYPQKDSTRTRLTRLAEQMAFLGLYDFSGNHAGTDLEPLLENGQTVGCGLSPDPQRYFDLHHTAADVFETVNHRELKLGAAAMAGMAWIVSQNGL